jgi:hypothetical protein
MKAIRFKQVNTELGKGQEEYVTLPCYYEVVQGSVLCAFELSEEEIERIQKDKKIYIRTLTFGHPFQPIALSTIFEDLFVRSWDLIDPIAQKYLEEILTTVSTGETEEHPIDLKQILKDHVTVIYRMASAGWIEARAGKSDTDLLVKLGEAGVKILNSREDYGG